MADQLTASIDALIEERNKARELLQAWLDRHTKLQAFESAYSPYVGERVATVEFLSSFNLNRISTEGACMIGHHADFYVSKLDNGQTCIRSHKRGGGLVCVMEAGSQPIRDDDAFRICQAVDCFERHQKNAGLDISEPSSTW